METKKNITHPEQKNLHKDHRSRMREKVIKNGFDSLADHEKLEYLLFYSIPRVNTNPTAHLLLEKFGSFAAVLDAPESELLKIDGIGQTSVNFLKLLPQVASCYVNCPRKKEKRFNNIKSICEYLVNSYIGITDERIRMICLDDKNYVLFDDFVQTGSVSHVGVDLYKLNEIAVSSHSSNIIIAHNHPTGICRPSMDDIITAKKLDEHFGNINIKIHAHVLVAEGTYCLIKDL